MSDPSEKPAPKLQSLAQLPAKKRLDALLDFEDAQLAVQSSSAEDLYLAIMEVGLDDATDIVQLASPAQFRTFVDLAGWKKDRLVPQELLTWLRAARGEDPEDFLEKVNKLDLEVLELLLHEHMVVHDLESDPDVNPEGFTYEMPEGKYLLEFPHLEGVDLQTFRNLVHDIVGAEPFLASRLFEAVRWEVRTELEETAYQFRSARLQDLGFPELYDALSIFAFTDPDKLLPEQAPPSARTELATSPPPVAYLEATFRELTEDERPLYEEHLRYLINSALVSEGAEPGDPDAIRTVSEIARDNLALGLEHVTGGDPSRAAAAVRRLGFKRIFQAGFSLALRLKFRVDRLSKQPGYSAQEVPLILPDEARVVAALRKKRPLRALKVEGAEPVPFRSKKELADALAAVERAELQVQVFTSLLDEARETTLGRFGPEFSQVGVERLWLATVVRAALGEAPFVAPVPREKLTDAGVALFEGEAAAPRIKAGVLQTVQERLGKGLEEAQRQELGRMIGWALGRLRDELGMAYLRNGKLGADAEAVLPVR